MFEQPPTPDANDLPQERIANYDGPAGAAFSGTVAGFSGQDTTHLTGSATIPWGDNSQSAGTSFTAPLASFTDADPGDSASSYNVAINWGDGSSTTTGMVGGSGGSFAVGGTHTYASAGVYEAILTITDPGGSSTTTQSPITVSSPSGPGALTVTPTLPPNLTEGTPFSGTVATFTDSDTTQLAGAYSATVTWGDGGSSSGTISGGNGTFTINAAHTYTDEGSESVTINVADVDGAQGQAGSTVAVAEADHLTVTAAPVAATEGTAFNGPVATFTDTDTTTLAGDFTATIAWGDGDFSTGTVSGGNGSFTINGAHTYADEGSYVIQVGVGDDGSGSATGSASGTATVAEGDVLTPHGLTPTATVNAAFSGAVATFTDTDTTNPYTDFTAQINWGDGNYSSGTVTGGNGTFTVSGTHTYTSASTFPVSVTLSDDSSGTATATASSTITVSYADTLNVTGRAFRDTEGTVNTGEVASFTDTNTSLGTGAFTAIINWGDGSSTTTGTVAGSGGSFTVTGTHAYADEGSFTISVSVSESQAATVTGTSISTVKDADSFTAQPNGTVSATEGVSFTGTVASFSDAYAGNSSDLTATVNWGDGSSTTTGTVVEQASRLFIESSHTYAEEGSYQVLVTLQDPGGTSARTTTTAFVADAALTGSGTSLSSNLGQAVNGIVANFSDADANGTVADYSAVIAWGDGQYSQGTIGQGSTSFTVSGTHAYAQAGAHTATVTIYDQGGAQAVADSTITVNSSSGSGKLTATGSPAQTTEGQSTSGLVVATFADSDGNGSASAYVATVLWGDGSSETATVTTVSGGFEVVGASGHSYAEEGSCTVYVAIQDSDGDAAYASSTVTVADAALSVTASALSPTAETLFAGSVATFTDADPRGVPSDYTATINWGDGSIATGGSIVSQAGQLTVEGGHEYTSAGSYAITVTVNDAGGATGSSTAAVTITAPAQTLTGTAITATEGTLFSGTVAVFTPSNPNDPASDFQATVAWGDGSQGTATLTSDGNGHLVVSGSHTWSDEAPAALPYGVTVTVVSTQDPTQNPLTETTAATVADAALTATGSSFSSWAGQPSGQVLVASFTDANPLSAVGDFTAAITWGDGVGSSQGVVEANGSGGYDVYGAYTYQNAGSYTVTVNITDDGGQTARVTTTATVNAPAASLNATEGAAFSGTVATFTGQDTTQLTGDATITWGDGDQSAGTITSTGPSSFTVSGGHTYLEEGLVPLSVTVGLTGNGSLVGQGMGVVQDAALGATGTTVTATQNVATGLVQVASFTDADPNGTLGDYTASVNWGDGSVTTGQIQADGHGGYEVLGNHTYLFSGSFTLSTTIQDGGGSSAVATSLAQAPDTSATGIGVMEGQTFEDDIPITINLVSGPSPPARFTATLNWGDGTSSQGLVEDTALNGRRAPIRHQSVVTVIVTVPIGPIGRQTFGTDPLWILFTRHRYKRS